MPQTDGTIARRGPEILVSEMVDGIGKAPCDACKEFHYPTQTTCGDKRTPVRQYIIGDYGWIKLNPEWVRNQAVQRFDVLGH